MPRFSLIGNGRCNGGPYNTEICNYDGNDCIEFNALYPGCEVENPWRVGDGRCDGGSYYTSNCGWDGGDCDQCAASAVDISKIGNGICDGAAYMTPECGNDGGDCKDCKVDKPRLIGDGNCQGNGKYNTTVCGWDGGDCL